MQKLLQNIRRLSRDDAVATSVVLSLLNLDAASPGALILLRSAINHSVSAALSPLAGPLPGALFHSAARQLNLTPADQLSLLGDYLHIIDEEPSYTMRQFLDDAFHATGEDAAASAAAPLPAEPASVEPVPGADAEEPVAEEPVADEADDGLPIDATFVIDEALLAAALATASGDPEMVPWWYEQTLSRRYQFNLDLRAREDGSPYIDAFISDHSRKRIYADWPPRESAFGEYTHVVEGRRIHVNIVATDVPTAPFD